MANEVDSELTPAVTDTSSGSLLGDNTTREGDVDSSAYSSPETGGKDKDDNRIVATSVTKNSKETEEARDINERGDGINKENKEMGEDEDQDRDMNLEAEAEKEPTLSLEDVDSSADSSLETGGKDKDDNRIVATSESKNSKETEEERDINERGDGINKENKEMGEDEDQDRDMNLDAEAEKEPTLSLEESLHLESQSSEFQRESQPQISVGGNDKLLWICAAVVLFASVVCGTLYFSDSTPPVPKEFNVVDVFNQEMEKLKTTFPNQRPELWRRSLIHLRRHLKTEQPTEPVSLILTSGHSAERTLGCLAQCLAHAFSTARNSSVLNINGKDKVSQDSDQVKLDIDSELKNAFEGKKFAAVIHRFEELPPGSTLIFYRYCDHENAAYKDVFLAFTVMLDTEAEVPSNVSLGRVEEMVQEHVKQKFVSSDKLATFNQMDVDKLSGLWSRISHLILPVAAEEKIEHQGCGEDCGKSF
ncbi:torsin-1A-interacting protein 1 [Siphateles boraxobius]|uniref:torsin-1A-interacting protein 1 n=1 Tax=Siphateles boraxobius TaxID=180520 RepID=UPI004063C779